MRETQFRGYAKVSVQSVLSLGSALRLDLRCGLTTNCGIIRIVQIVLNALHTNTTATIWIRLGTMKFVGIVSWYDSKLSSRTKNLGDNVSTLKPSDPSGSETIGLFSNNLACEIIRAI